MNTVDFEALQAQEDKVVQEILSRGFLDPRKTYPQLFSFENSRRYITELKDAPYSSLEENQVSEYVIDEKRATHELAPLIREEGLQNPPLAMTTAIGTKLKLLTGHHRSFALASLGQQIPVIIVTELLSLNNTSVSADADLIQGIAANPRNQNRTYSKNDVALQVELSLKKNPYQDGLNPSGKLPPRHSDDPAVFAFDDMLKRLKAYEHFPNPGDRTKIYNLVKRGAVRSKQIDMKLPAEQTNHLIRQGWATGIKENGKRVAATEHYDSARNALIVMVDDNGRHLDEKLLKLALMWYDVDDRHVWEENNIKFIDIAGRIASPPGDKASLDTKRLNFKQRVAEWNETLQNFGVGLRIRYLALPKQLKTPSDKDVTYTINA